MIGKPYVNVDDMNADQLAKVYRQQLSDTVWIPRMRPERVQQYKEVWPTESDFIEEMSECPTGWRV